MILLDTNILLRDADTPDPAHAAVRGAINTLQSNGELLCVVPQNLYEFWAAATRPTASNGLGLPAKECQSQVALIKKMFYFLYDVPSLFDEWEVLIQTHACHGRISYDARLVAAMQTHGIARILTLNGTDFARFSGVTIIDPRSFATPSAQSGESTHPANGVSD